MPGQFVNSGNTPGGKISLVNNSNSGNFNISTPASGPSVFSFAGKWSFMDRIEACGGFNTATYYSTTPLASVTNGTQIYTDIELTTTPNQSFIGINGISYSNSSGVLSSGVACPFRATVTYALSDVCNTSDGSTEVIGNAPLFCDCTSLQSGDFIGLPSGTIYQIKYGNSYNTFLTNGGNTVTATSTCVPC